jgi:hypothetical protein
VDDKNLYVAFDGNFEQYFVALDKATGETRWKKDRNAGIEWKKAGGKPGDNKKSFATATLIEVDGQRLNVSDPEHSLIVLKPTEQTDHEGGRRFEVGSWEHHLLLGWIESDAGGTMQTDSARTGKGKFAAEEVRFFKESIQPIFRNHCYECHGFNAKKRNLSLANREGLLAGGDSGPAIVPGIPEQSLLIAALGHSNEELQMPHSGMLAVVEISALEKWVRMGAPWPDGYGITPGDTAQVFVNLLYEPKEILFSESGQTQHLKIIAEWEDGTREDVTCLARFQTSNDAIVRVNRDGLVTSIGVGDTHIIALYDNGVAAIPVLRPYGDGRFRPANTRPGKLEAHPTTIPLTGSSARNSTSWDSCHPNIARTRSFFAESVST